MDPVYLKNPDRVAGFGYVAVLALAIARLLQTLARLVPLGLPEGLAFDQPSARVLLRLLDVPLLTLKVQCVFPRLAPPPLDASFGGSRVQVIASELIGPVIRL